MAASDPIVVSWQKDQEREGNIALQAYLAPWMATFVDTRDDVGRDGLIQIVDTDARGGNSASPLTCLFQCKTLREGTAERPYVDFDTRHILLWTEEGSACVVLVHWTKATGQFHFRLASDAREETERFNPNWRAQRSVRVEFRSEHTWTSNNAAKSAILVMVSDWNDVRGGISKYHASRRRTLLACLAGAEMTTAQTIELEGPVPSRLYIGTGWARRDIEPSDFEANRVLARSLLLYEESWAPIGYLRLLHSCFGESRLIRLFEQNRIVPFIYEANIGLMVDRGGPMGRVVNAEHPVQYSTDATVEKHLGSASTPSRIRSYTRYIRRLDRISSQRVRMATVADLNRADLREMLGLKRVVTELEPVWDANLVNRLAAINVMHAAAEMIRADTIHYEAGLSRLASAKKYADFGLDRLFPTSAAFDRSFRESGVPDIGLLVDVVSLDGIAEMSNAPQAQQFRDWFWAEVGRCSQIGEMRSEYIVHAKDTFVPSGAASGLPIDLKQMMYMYQMGQYELGFGTQRSARHHLSTALDGDAVMRRQRELHRLSRRSTLKLYSTVLSPYARCLCGSGEKFKFCCSR